MFASSLWISYLGKHHRLSSLLLENQLYLPCLPPHIAENTKKKRKLMMIDITTSTVRWQPTALYVDDIQLLCLIIGKNFHIPNLMSL